MSAAMFLAKRMANSFESEIVLTVFMQKCPLPSVILGSSLRLLDSLGTLQRCQLIISYCPNILRSFSATLPLEVMMYRLASALVQLTVQCFLILTTFSLEQIMGGTCEASRLQKVGSIFPLMMVLKQNTFASELLQNTTNLVGIECSGVVTTQVEELREDTVTDVCSSRSLEPSSSLNPKSFWLPLNSITGRNISTSFSFRFMKLLSTSCSQPLRQGRISSLTQSLSSPTSSNRYLELVIVVSMCSRCRHSQIVTKGFFSHFLSQLSNFFNEALSAQLDSPKRKIWLCVVVSVVRMLLPSQKPRELGTALYLKLMLSRRSTMAADLGNCLRLSKVHSPSSTMVTLKDGQAFRQWATTAVWKLHPTSTTECRV